MGELPMLCAPNTISQTPRVRKPQHMGQRQRSDKNPLDLIQANGIIGAIVELRRARRLVVRDLLRILNCTTVLEVGSDASGPEGMTAGRLGQPRLPNPPFDHGEHLYSEPKVRTPELVWARSPLAVVIGGMLP